MQAFNVVIAVGDCMRAQNLAAALHPHFRNVSVARDEEELRRKLVREQATAALVDLDTVDLNQLSALCRDFTDVNIVCAHRTPDEAVWMEILAAGASDCCGIDDVKAIQEALTPKESQQEPEKQNARRKGRNAA